jgi:hypothetical protein
MRPAICLLLLALVAVPAQAAEPLPDEGLRACFAARYGSVPGDEGVFADPVARADFLACLEQESAAAGPDRERLKRLWLASRRDFYPKGADDARARIGASLTDRAWTSLLDDMDAALRGDDHDRVRDLVDESQEDFYAPARLATGAAAGRLTEAVGNARLDIYLQRGIRVVRLRAEVRALDPDGDDDCFVLRKPRLTGPDGILHDGREPRQDRGGGVYVGTGIGVGSRSGVSGGVGLSVPLFSLFGREAKPVRDFVYELPQEIGRLEDWRFSAFVVDDCADSETEVAVPLALE